METGWRARLSVGGGRLSQDLGKLATSFGLLYMPKMKETKHSKVPIVFRPSRIHADDVKFKDKCEARGEPCI